MKPQKILSILSFLLVANSSLSYAQDETDAFRYSMLSPMGTARSSGFGNAVGAVGGDFSSLSVNPAGLGIYRRSEFMLTPSVKMNNMNAKYLGNESDASTARFNFNNLGLVLTWSGRGKRYDNSDWKAISFGIGFNRLADFKNEYLYHGKIIDNSASNYGSFSQIFAENANANSDNVNTNGTYGFLGYQTYLVNYDSSTHKYYSLANPTTGLNQLKSVEEKGGMNEMVISLGGNYKEKIMMGASIGLPSINYTRTSKFDESDASGNPDNNFTSFSYKETLNTKGNGINLKLGVILKPSDLFRIGIAIHTPTIYTLTDIYNNSLYANTENYVTGAPTHTQANDENQFSYTLITPMKSVLSGMVFLGKYGFISADFEHMNYGSMRYRFNSDFSSDAGERNGVIDSTFGKANNIRLGIELKYDDFFFRGGYGMYGNPYKNSSNKYNRNELSVGVGYRSGDFFTDIALVHLNIETTEQAYALPTPFLVPTANMTTNRNTIAWTIGWKL